MAVGGEVISSLKELTRVAGDVVLWILRWGRREKF